MRGVTIRQLQIFVTAAGHLSFVRTSEQLHLTQAAVSLQIKRLEEIAGIALFERRPQEAGPDRGRASTCCATRSRSSTR